MNRENQLLDKSLIPLDKSWIIRMGVLDLIHGQKYITQFLSKQKTLNDDLLILKNVCQIWATESKINVGESGTLFRFLKFANWKLNLGKVFQVAGTLARRNVCNDPSIIFWDQKRLLTLDNGTSQWASAAVLMGDSEKIKKPPYKLAVTYEAVQHWQQKRSIHKRWLPRYDNTILGQAATFIDILKGKTVSFKPMQAEDYCFARMFGYITKEEGEKRWPSLRGHESNRIIEVEKILQRLKNSQTVESRDHRVVQAAAMYQKFHHGRTDIAYPQSVNKSWPQFWDYMDNLNDLVTG